MRQSDTTTEALILDRKVKIIPPDRNKFGQGIVRSAESACPDALRDKTSDHLPAADRKLPLWVGFGAAIGFSLLVWVAIAWVISASFG